MADEKTFWPFHLIAAAEVGDILLIVAVHDTVPERLLPARVRLDSVYHRQTGYQWYARHDSGMICFPDVPGDGEPSLRQIVGWLERHGYRDATPGLGDPPIYERTVV